MVLHKFDNDYDVILWAFLVLIDWFAQEDNLFTARCIWRLASKIQFTEILTYYGHYKIFPSDYISNYCRVHPKHSGVLDGSNGSDRTSYPLTENYRLPVAQVTDPSLLDWCSGLQVHLGAPGSTLHHCRAIWEKHLLWECCWCAWRS